MTPNDAAARFEPHRRYLVGVAYRMLGSLAEAEDTVQDAFLRWHDLDRSEVEHDRAYLRRVVARLGLDRLKSARARREEYVGPWLPDPLVGDLAEPAPESRVADDVSVALLLTLERLSPLERAAFLLRDVFDMDYAAIAGVLDRSEAACRQLAARARKRVRDETPRFSPEPETETRLLSAFASALHSGDVSSLAELVAEDAVLYSDGGGKRTAALNPIYGRGRILRFAAGIIEKRQPPDAVEAARINGLPGFILRTGGDVETLALAIRAGEVAAVYAVRNPDKLRHLA